MTERLAPGVEAKREDNTARERALAAALTRKLFEGRTGHGGGPCTKRVLGPEAIEELILGAYRLLRA